jgi:hypothetical protein
VASKFAKVDLVKANARLKMLSFYPSDSEAQAAVMELLAKMCPSLEALTWLVDTMTNRVGTWKGPAELRGVLCWHCRPADGIEAPCSITGFTPQDGETLTIERGYRDDRPLLVSGDADCRALVRSIADKRRLM